MSQQTAFKLISQLVSDFKTNESKYLSPAYSEADVRKDFIDKFFNALGWDVYHNEQKNPYEQEVKIERGVQMGRQQKRADYAFYLQPNFRDVKFYLEAKKPSRNLTNSDDYFQACRYGWNAGTSITFLTDFEELHILDCRTKPDITSILNNKIKKYHYSEYADKEKFAEIYWLLSREAVDGNSLEKFSESLPKPKGKTIGKGTHRGAYQSIDEAFLEELDEIRNSLARAFKKSNPHLGSDELTEMTQRTIDRLVFIRFLEDKQIEPDHYVSQFAVSDKAWKDFTVSSRKLDAKYNGVVFKKHAIDTDNFIEPEDKTFASICEELAHLNSPYNFDIIPIHILGSIYERFLGKVVIATDKRVRIEEKPEVRKAGGVYYTPQYIVNYIVDNTVVKLIEEKTPKEISKMHFADISCGSGSFLITVFDRLLGYHRKWYQLNPNQAKKDGCYFQDGVWILSLKQKQNILTNNIYGVDLDAQAVEVTQLSLYLKLLEDETTATAQDTWVMFKEQLLPNLNKNIICGNSLIGTDILEGKLFNREEELKLKPMNFEDVFPEVMANGGFDAIVGNPPWGATFNQIELDYLREKYSEIIVRMIDSFMYFIKETFILIKKGGKVGLILPDVFLYQVDNEKLRTELIQKTTIEEVVNLGDVFKGVTRPTCLLFYYNESNKNTLTKIFDLSDKKRDEKNDSTLIESSSFSLSQDYFLKLPNCSFITRNIKYFEVIDRIKTNCATVLGQFVDEDGIQRGISPDLKKAFIVDSKTINKNRLEKRLLRRTLTGGIHVKRFFIKDEDLWIIYSNRRTNIKEFPNIKNFIESFKMEITCSEVKQNKHSLYSLHRAREEKIFAKKEKIVGVITEDEIIVALDDKQIYFTDGLYLFGAKEDVSSKYLLGILNSNLMVFLYKTLCMESGRVLAQVKPNLLEKLPIKMIDEKNQTQQEIYNKIINYVDQMLETKKQLHTAKTESEKEYLEKKCANIDRQIDALVYELYELTPEEIAIVENSVK